VITLGFNQKAAVRAGRPHSQINLFLRLCGDVARFMQENGGERFKAFFALDRGLLGLYLMTSSEAYDFELSGKLAEFAAPYIERGLLDSASLLPASSMEELGAFFDPKKALRVEIEYAELR
jgi:hypothetical protein